MTTCTEITTSEFIRFVRGVFCKYNVQASIIRKIIKNESDEIIQNIVNEFDNILSKKQVVSNDATILAKIYHITLLYLSTTSRKFLTLLQMSELAMTQSNSTMLNMENIVSMHMMFDSALDWIQTINIHKNNPDIITCERMEHGLIFRLSE